MPAEYKMNVECETSEFDAYAARFKQMPKTAQATFLRSLRYPSDLLSGKSILNPAPDVAVRFIVRPSKLFRDFVDGNSTIE